MAVPSVNAEPEIVQVSQLAPGTAQDVAPPGGLYCPKRADVESRMNSVVFIFAINSVQEGSCQQGREAA